jgi:glycosyltransferase A (GT-A) superfamily protein (DUF2064 family)
MPKPKFDRVELSKALRAGKSQTEIAKQFGVSAAAISRAKKELNINVVKNLALESAHKAVDKSLNAVEQLQRINMKANRMLDELTGEDKLIDRIVNAVQGALTYEGEPGKQAAYVQRIVKQVAQDRFLALKAMQEIRGQLTLQLDILKTMYDLTAVKEFQTEVLEAIGNASPEVKKAIIQKLKQAKALRGSVEIK